MRDLGDKTLCEFICTNKNNYFLTATNIPTEVLDPDHRGAKG